MKTFSTTCSTAICAILLMQAVPAQSQNARAGYEVRYLDIRHDTLSPEFWKPCQVTPGGGTVDQKLESMGSPIPGGANPKMTRCVRRWFLDWGPGFFSTYKYTKTGSGANECWAEPGDEYDIDNDSAYYNEQVWDSLYFNKISTGNYELVKDPFFPMDNKGMGNGGEAHNYAFTMSLIVDFAKPKDNNASVTINSSDDSWVFIEYNLFIDLGGAHPRMAKDTTVFIDPSKYPTQDTIRMHIYYANRGSTSPYLKIKLNNFPALPEIGVVRGSTRLINPFTAMKVYRSAHGIEINTPSAGIRHAELVSLQGKVLCSIAPAAAGNHVTLPATQQGMYLVRTITDKGVATGSIAIVK